MSDVNKLSIEVMKGAIDAHRKKRLRAMMQDGVTQDAEEKPLSDEEARLAMLELGNDGIEEETEEEDAVPKKKKGY